MARHWIFIAAAGALLASPSPIEAQDGTGRLVGQVVGGTTATPVSGAAVRLPALDRAALTDPSGRFVLDEVPAGTHRLEVQRLGYAPVARTVRVTPGSTATVTVSLETAPVPVPGISVEVATESFLPGFVQRRVRREGHFFTKGQIEELDPERTSGIFHGLPNVDVAYTPPHRQELGEESGRRVTLYHQMRTTRGQPWFCAPTLLLNGWHVLPDWWRLDHFEPEEILAIEAYWRPHEVPTSFPVGPNVTFTGMSEGTPVFQRGDVSGGLNPDITPTRPFASSCGTIVVWTELRPER